MVGHQQANLISFRKPYKAAFFVCPVLARSALYWNNRECWECLDLTGTPGSGYLIQAQCWREAFTAKSFILFGVSMSPPINGEVTGPVCRYSEVRLVPAKYSDAFRLDLGNYTSGEKAFTCRPSPGVEQVLCNVPGLQCESWQAVLFSQNMYPSTCIFSHCLAEVLFAALMLAKTNCNEPSPQQDYDGRQTAATSMLFSNSHRYRRRKLPVYEFKTNCMQVCSHVKACCL